MRGPGLHQVQAVSQLSGQLFCNNVSNELSGLRDAGHVFLFTKIKVIERLHEDVFKGMLSRVGRCQNGLLDNRSEKTDQGYDWSRAVDAIRGETLIWKSKFFA